MSSYNPEYKDSFYFVDGYNMVLGQNHSWNPDGDNGKGDSIGRTKDAYFTWEDPRFIEAIKKCWHKVGDEKDIDYPDLEYIKKYWYVGYRHPDVGSIPNNMSRDHTKNTIMALIIANDPFLYELCNHLKWRISPTHAFTVDLWAWKNMVGKRWWISRFLWSMIYYTISIPIAIVTVLWHLIIYKLGEFGEEKHQDEFEPTPNNLISEKQRKYRKLLFPYYALYLQAWELFLMKPHPARRILQKIYGTIVPRYNYMIKLLLNVDKKSFNKFDIIQYKPMKGGRWKTALNNVNDRDCRIITNAEYLKYNTMDKDLLIKLWNLRNKNDKIETK